VVIAIAAWSALIGVIWLTKGGHIGACLLDAVTGEIGCTPSDTDVPQLAVWLIGIAAIVGVGLALGGRRLGAVGVIVAAISMVAILALALMALPGRLGPTGRQIEQEAASQIAMDYVVDGLESGTQVLSTHVTDVKKFSGAWRVWIDASVRYPGGSSSQPTPVHLVIDVDMTTGTPSRYASG
jgi:hypothetical protein